MARSLRRGVLIALVFLIFNFQFLIFHSLSYALFVKAVDAVGMTISDMDRSLDFYTKVLSFEKISDTEVTALNTKYFERSSAHACVSCD